MAPSEDREQLGLFGDDVPVGAARGGSVAPAVAPPAFDELAARLPPTVRLGTSSWSFPGWAGIVYALPYPTEALARDGLASYARHPLLRAVGLDRTYYAPVEARDLARYAALVPEGFRFLVKAHELCTLSVLPQTPRHGAHAGERNPRFLDAAYAADAVVAPAALGLGAKLGTLLFQFAPLPAEVTHDPPAFAAKLHAFLAALPRGPRYAVELRSRVLLVRDYVQALQAAGAVHCLNAHPKMPPVAEQHAFVSGARSAGAMVGPLVVRWMLGHGLAYEEARDRYRPFDRLVDEDRTTRRIVASLVAAAAKEGREATVIINNKAEGSAPLSAIRLASAIAATSEGGAPEDAP